MIWKERGVKMKKTQKPRKNRKTGAVIVILLGLLCAVSTVRSCGTKRVAIQGKVDDVVYVGQGSYDPANDGKIVIVCGELKVLEPAYDDELGLTIYAPRAMRSAKKMKLKKWNLPATEENMEWNPDLGVGGMEIFQGAADVGDYHLSEEFIEQLMLGREYEFDEETLSEAEDRIKNHGDFKVVVDSPLAVEATKIFNMNIDETYDEEAMELVKQGINPITFSNLHLSITTEESKEINFETEPMVIISASGMCEAGRIRHHLKHNLWRSENTIIFVGYQAYGTLGRSLIEGAKEVKLFGEVIKVAADIVQLEGLSGHADKNGLLKWVNSFEKKPEEVFVVHGEDAVCEAFTSCLKDEYKFKARAPYSGDVFDLITGEWTEWGSRERIQKKPKQSSAYIRLLTASERLKSVIEHNEGGTNKDLGKFADQIIALCDKWER